MADLMEMIRGRVRMMREPLPAEHQCSAFCRALGLEAPHEIRRTGLQVAEMVRKMRTGETLTGL